MAIQETGMIQALQKIFLGHSTDAGVPLVIKAAGEGNVMFPGEKKSSTRKAIPEIHERQAPDKIAVVKIHQESKIRRNDALQTNENCLES